MKRGLLVLLSLLFLTSCGGISNNSSGGDEMSIEKKEETISSLDSLNNEMKEIMTTGSELIDVLSSMNGLSQSEEYDSLFEADDFVKQMKPHYANVMKLCEEYEDLSGMAFQVKILDHSCPNPITGSDSTAINNQKILYQLHLKQLSSSFSILSKYMDYLAGNAEKPEEEKYFSEVPEIPTPDTVMDEITFDSEINDSGVIQYMYLIGDTEEDANMNYNAYIVALGLCEGLSVDITADAVYVNKNGTMVSAMMAGTDPDKGRFMIVSFQE